MHANLQSDFRVMSSQHQTTEPVFIVYPGTGAWFSWLWHWWTTPWTDHRTQRNRQLFTLTITPVVTLAEIVRPGWECEASLSGDALQLLRGDHPGIGERDEQNKPRMYTVNKLAHESWSFSFQSCATDRFGHGILLIPHVSTYICSSLPFFYSNSLHPPSLTSLSSPAVFVPLVNLYTRETWFVTEVPCNH